MRLSPAPLICTNGRGPTGTKTPNDAISEAKKRLELLPHCPVIILVKDKGSGETNLGAIMHAREHSSFRTTRESDPRGC